MKTITKIILSIILLIIYAIVVLSWSIVESPVKGAIAAQQLNDTMSSYVANQVVNSNGIGYIVVFGHLFLQGLIWFPYARFSRSSKQ